MRIYVASSWRNFDQPRVVGSLRSAGHEVYDFRHPTVDDHGFNWREIDPAWQDWSLAEYRRQIRHPIATHGFERDKEALDWCDACVLVLPCGKSAHLELGYAVAAQKLTAILLAKMDFEPELMYRFCDDLFIDLEELLAAWSVHVPRTRDVVV